MLSGRNTALQLYGQVRHRSLATGVGVTPLSSHESRCDTALRACEHDTALSQQQRTPRSCSSASLPRRLPLPLASGKRLHGTRLMPGGCHYREGTYMAGATPSSEAAGGFARSFLQAPRAPPSPRRPTARAAPVSRYLYRGGGGRQAETARPSPHLGPGGGIPQLKFGPRGAAAPRCSLQGELSRAALTWRCSPPAGSSAGPARRCAPPPPHHRPCPSPAAAAAAARAGGAALRWSGRSQAARRARYGGASGSTRAGLRSPGAGGKAQAGPSGGSGRCSWRAGG